MLGIFFIPFSEKELLTQPKNYKALKEVHYKNHVSHFRIQDQMLYFMKKILFYLLLKDSIFFNCTRRHLKIYFVSVVVLLTLWQRAYAILRNVST